MKKMLSIMMVTLLVFVSVQAFADDSFSPSKEDSELIFQTSESFSQCAGNLKAAAWLLGMAGKTEAQKEFEGMYRGWYLSAAYLLNSTGVVTDWPAAIRHSESIAMNTEQSYKSTFELAPDDLIDNILSDFNLKCKVYTEYQEELVIEMRRSLATAPTKETKED